MESFSRISQCTMGSGIQLKMRDTVVERPYSPMAVFSKGFGQMIRLTATVVIFVSMGNIMRAIFSMIQSMELGN